MPPSRRTHALAQDEVKSGRLEPSQQQKEFIGLSVSSGRMLLACSYTANQCIHVPCHLGQHVFVLICSALLTPAPAAVPASASPLPEHISVFESRWEESFNLPRPSEDTGAHPSHAPSSQVSRPSAAVEGGEAAAVQKKHAKTAAGHHSVATGGDVDGEVPGLAFRMV